MRIGTFAKRFDVTIETIRYYMELGLLIPEKKAAHYHFTPNCVDDMEWIMELKQLRFSLQEIQKILSFRRISQFADNEDLDFYIEFLRDKKQRLQDECNELNRSIRLLDVKIQETSTLLPAPGQTGVPLSFIPLLACPHCRQTLPVKNAYLLGQHVLEADLTCICGYCAQIKEGILLTASRSISPMQDYFIYDQDIFPQLAPSWISLMEKGSLWIYNMLSEMKQPRQTILQTNVDVYVFSPKYLASLPPDMLHIFTANSPLMLKKLKGKLEHLNPSLNVLYMVNSDLCLPLHLGSIDTVIDTLSFNDFSLYSAASPLACLLPCLKTEARILGIQMYYQPGAKSLQNLRTLYPDAHPQNFEPDFISNLLVANGFEKVGQDYMGFTTDPGSYLDYHLEQERIHLASYYGRRDTAHQSPSRPNNKQSL